MTRNRAQRYTRILTSVIRELDLTPGAPVRWRPEYRPEFDGPDQLRLALLTRWRTIVEAQDQDVTLSDLVAAHPGLAGVAGRSVARHDRAMAAS